MVIAGRQRREKQKWWSGNKEVEEHEEFKYLGVWMDAKLKGSTHMEKRIERAVEANQRLGWMGRVNGVMEAERGAAIWESMGLPAANFAIEVSWNRPVGSKFEMVRPNYSAKRAHNVLGHAYLHSRLHAALYASSRMIMLSNCFSGRFEAVVAES